MEELEDPTEQLKEIREHLEEKEEAREKWTLHVALSTAVIAVLAAIAGLFANHHSNEALLEQVRSSDKWAYYQSKSIKSEIAAGTAQLLTAFDKPLPADYEQKQKGYEKDKAEIKQAADEADKSSAEHLNKHLVLSKAVTIFQIAIAISAISILTRKRAMWYVSMLFAAAGCVFLVLGFLTS